MVKWKIRLTKVLVALTVLYGVYQFISYCYVLLTTKNVCNNHMFFFLGCYCVLFVLGSIQQKHKCQARACAYYDNGYCIHEIQSGSCTRYQDCEHFVDTYN